MEHIHIIKEYRNKTFMTQEELAAILHVSYVTVNRWENSHYNPTMKQKRIIYKLCEEKGLI